MPRPVGVTVAMGRAAKRCFVSTIRLAQKMRNPRVSLSIVEGGTRIPWRRLGPPGSRLAENQRVIRNDRSAENTCEIHGYSKTAHPNCYGLPRYTDRLRLDYEGP